jgi:hypothetical protein
MQLEVDFVAICFTFAGIFFMLENLGNIPLQVILVVCHVRWY